MHSVDLPREMAIALLAAAQGRPEEEVCGLVAARNGEAVRLVPVSNVADDRRHRFEMDERELIDAMKTMRERGETLFATWHSHPDAAPALSPLDIERLGYTDIPHLVISLQTKGVLQVSAWRINGANAQAMELRIREAC